MDLKELLGKKKALDPDMKDAKLKAIKQMRQVASDAMSDDLKGTMSKATVIAKDKAGLKEGLEKAKDIVESPELEAAEETTGMDLDDDNEEGEDVEHQASVLGASESGYETGDEDEESELEEVLEHCDTPEKIDELMMKLAEKKRALKA